MMTRAKHDARMRTWLASSHHETATKGGKVRKIYKNGAHAAALCAALVVSGCAAHAHGNFLPSGYETAVVATIAADAAAVLVDQSLDDSPQRFAFAHSAADPFGRKLADALRQGGHAVTPQGSGARSVIYVVDQLRDTDWLRVALTLDGVQLARAYTATGKPVGPWSRHDIGPGGDHE